MKLLKKLMTLIPNSMQPREYTQFANACDKWITYTDGFKLVRIPNTTELRGVYTKAELNKFIVASIAEPIDANFPNTERVMPDRKKLTHTIDVNAKLLMDVLKVVSAGSKHNKVRIHINPNDKMNAILITADGSEGIIIPLRVD